ASTVKPRLSGKKRLSPFCSRQNQAACTPHSHSKNKPTLTTAKGGHRWPRAANASANKPPSQRRVSHQAACSSGKTVRLTQEKPAYNGNGTIVHPVLPSANSGHHGTSGPQPANSPPGLQTSNGKGHHPSSR